MTQAGLSSHFNSGRRWTSKPGRVSTACSLPTEAGPAFPQRPFAPQNVLKPTFISNLHLSVSSKLSLVYAMETTAANSRPNMTLNVSVFFFLEVFSDVLAAKQLQSNRQRLCCASVHISD